MAFTMEPMASACTEDDGPSSHNIFDKTFQICDRMDSNASVVFTDITDDPGALAAVQKDTLDSFSISEDSTPASSPEKPANEPPRTSLLDAQSRQHPASKLDRALSPSQQQTPLPEASLPLANGLLDDTDHKCQVADKRPEDKEKNRDSATDDTHSVLSTVALDGSVASAASIDAPQHHRQSIDSTGMPNMALETQVNGTLEETSNPDSPQDQELAITESQRESTVGGEAEADQSKDADAPQPDLVDPIRSAQQIARAQSPEGNTPSLRETATPGEGTKRESEEESVPDRPRFGELALGNTTEDTPAEDEKQVSTHGGETDNDKGGPTQTALRDSTDLAALKTDASASHELQEGDSKNAATDDLYLLTPGRQGEERAEPSGSSANSPEREQVALKDLSAFSQAAASSPSQPTINGPEIQDSFLPGANFPTTPDTITPSKGKTTGRSSQDSDGPQTSVSSGKSKALNPVSQPFVPSVQKAGPSEASRMAFAKPLNAKAAEFVPSGQAAGSQAPPSSHAFQPLQFGDLPDSLNASPHPINQDQTEWQGQYNGYYFSPHEGEWQGAWGDYDYTGGYDESGFGHADNGFHLKGEEEDELWDPSKDGYENGWSGDAEASHAWNGQDVSTRQEELYEDQYGNVRQRKYRSPRQRGFYRRAGNDTRNGWAASAVDLLTEQFGFHRASIREMLELHDGNLEVVLDMLAQLEAEKDGLLPASSQDAPELNEENFPSLGGCQGQASRQKSQPSVDFAAAVRATANPGTGLPSQPPATSRSDPTPAQAASSEPLPWVQTGTAVSSLYSSAREEARDHARLRNQYFQQATKAYIFGNKGLARKLSQQGREESELMKAAHVAASQAIYKHRNPTAGRKGKTGLVDLHGLHVKEAIAMLEEQIEAVRRTKPKTSRPLPQRLSVLVGTGHHTKGSRTPSRLPPAVEEYLKASQISYNAPAPGVLDLMI